MKDLKGFANYLRRYHLDAISVENLDLALEMKIPIMQHYTHLSREQLLEGTYKSFEAFLTTLENATAIDKVRENIVLWEEDKIPGFSQNDLAPSDLILLYALQKKVLLKFLPQYTLNIIEVVNIIHELDAHYMEAQNLAIQALFRIKKKTSDKLLESEERYRDLIENATDLIHIASIEGIIQYANKAWLQALGYTKEDLGILTYQKVVHPDDLKKYNEERGRALLDEAIEEFTFAFLSKSGKKIFVDGSLNCQFDKGKPVSTRGIFKDITLKRVTEKKLIAYVEKLKESEERFRLLVENIKDYSIFMIDPQGDILTWNAGAETIKGYSSKEIIGKNISIFYTDDEIKENEPKINLELAKENGRYEREGWRVRKDGSKFWANIIYTALYDKDGNITGFVKVTRDMSERKRNDEKIEKTIRQLAQAQQMASIGSWEWDMVSDEISWSDELFRIWGFKPQEFPLSFKEYLDFIHPEDRERANAVIFKAIEEKKGFHFEHRIIRKSGEIKIINSQGRIFQDAEGKSILMSGTAQDITERVQTKTELKKAEDMVKAKQQFLSNMSHEIRTPMNSIIGFTKVVLKTDLNPKQKEYIEAIKVSGDTLMVLINDILDLAKVDEGKIVFEEVPFILSDSISAMLHLFEIKLQEKNIQLRKLYDPKIPKVLMGDSVRLHQIILNLMGNAVKFTKKGHIIVEVRLVNEEEENVNVKFSFTDTGIGIPPDRIDDIFENFQQVHHSTARLYGGTGLGLAIVKQLVERQGGSIKVKSRVDVGSVFTVNLNFKKAAKDVELKMMEQEDQAGFETGVKMNNIKVLVVEDIPLNQLLIKTLLTDFGCEQEVAENGKIAVEKLKKKEFDVVLMDLQMPVMNGFEATEYIRKSLHLDVPIIGLTADVTTADMDRCVAAGMNDYVPKPIDEHLLYNKIMSALRKTEIAKINTESPTEREKKEAGTYINLNYMADRTRNNKVVMREMIKAYIEHTPFLVNNLKEGARKGDWGMIQAAAHALIPSFTIVGLPPDFENKARKIEDYAREQKHLDILMDLVLKIEHGCNEACKELTRELSTIDNETESMLTTSNDYQ